MLIQILQQVHYLPPSWKGKTHTKGVAIHFQTLFQYRFVNFFFQFVLFSYEKNQILIDPILIFQVSLIMELFSPLLTPFILFSFRNHALDIVDFYRNFTVRILGIGDVCSFAQVNLNLIQLRSILFDFFILKLYL